MPAEGARFEGVLLDVDGTLVDSVDAHTRAWLEALRESGIEIGYTRMRHLIGMGGDRIMPLVAGVPAESDIGERIAKCRGELFLATEVPKLRPTRGAREFLDALAAWGGPLAIATSAKPDELRALLEVVDATDLLEVAASAEDVDASKPSPDVVEAALERVRLPPGEVVLLGDTGYDIESAATAGVSAIALRSGGWVDRDLAGAVAIYDDPADLLDNAAASPLAGILARDAVGSARGD
jgi:phosphoglycolate phosphatase-like HAD superfamily hydrolase